MATAEERKQYELKHPHIAPDLRDGITTQNVKTDVFFLRRLLLKCVPSTQYQAKYAGLEDVVWQTRAQTALN